MRFALNVCFGLVIFLAAVRHEVPDQVRDGGGLGGQLARCGKGNQALGLFIPEIKACAFDALGDCHAAHLDQFVVVAQDLCQPVERDAAIEVVDVVDADVRGEPPQDWWQIVV